MARDLEKKRAWHKAYDARRTELARHSRPPKERGVRIPETPAVLGYIAGIIDGEAYIGVDKSWDTVTRGNGCSPFYRANVQVKSTDARIIDFLIEYVGGYHRIERRQTVNGRTVFVWAIYGADAATVLTAVSPYLVGKREQADIIINFRETFSSHYNNPCTPPEVLAFRETCYQQLKQIHGQFSGRSRPEPDRSEIPHRLPKRLKEADVVI